MNMHIIIFLYLNMLVVCVCIYLFFFLIEEYHAVCGPCGTISPRIARFSYSSLKRVDRVRKANRASQRKVGDSARMRERVGDSARIRERC